jgi:mono/diheme cytochrome c family protein
MSDMKIQIAVAAVVLGVAAIDEGSSTRLAAQQTTARSVLDGVYTLEQARRGDTLYRQFCASCHGPALAGDDETPGLTGGPFMSNWNGTTVGELADRIRLSMPANNPGKLSRQESVDVLAYILSYNTFPAGEVELARESEILSQIRILPPKP